MGQLHPSDAPASLSRLPTAAPCLAECWCRAGVLHDAGTLAIPETVLYRIPPLTSGRERWWRLTRESTPIP